MHKKFKLISCKIKTSILKLKLVDSEAKITIFLAKSLLLVFNMPVHSEEILSPLFNKYKQDSQDLIKADIHIHLKAEVSTLMEKHNILNQF